MKNKTFHEMQLKKQLRDKKNNGVKVVIWNLTPKSRQLIESFGYYVETYI
jgi:anti-anti-sigma regulatory factor